MPSVAYQDLIENETVEASNAGFMTPGKLSAMMLSPSMHRARGPSTADFLSRRALEKPALAELWNGHELGKFLETTGKQGPNRYALSILADQPMTILGLFPSGGAPTQATNIRKQPIRVSLMLLGAVVGRS